ncbi:MAG TPA: hypothetical protein VHD83_08675 [Puia sp.]|nr:hypothetical protein [Puia sp.]
MKHFIVTMLILLSILGKPCAQLELTRRVAQSFTGISAEHLQNRFWIDMGKGNRLCLELEDGQDLEKFSNIDSLLMVFLADMKPFDDSLSDPLSWHLIDYVVDAGGKKRVRFQSFHPTASSFLLDQAEPAALRLEQDTIQIVLEYPVTTGRRHDGIRQDRLSLYVNNYHEISNYITGGLNEKIRWLQKNVNGYWVRDKDVYLAEKDRSISAPLPAGYVHMSNDQLYTIIQVNMGNYKNYFAPSFSLGLGLSFKREESTRKFMFLWQPLFLFGTNAQGHMQTYRNEFVIINIFRDRSKQQPFNYINFDPSISFGFMVRRDGDFFQKNSYFLGIGHVNLYKHAIELQPGMYFHDLFKEATPSVRLNFNL